ncbi:MAG: AraC family transcriptional regulator [Clostridia bacterium]|nr:AraC family transcriptional regulator [Clostridia bacterium]
MDWIENLQNAIDYIEENITEKIDYEEVAKHAYSSSFHFQRVFGITCGFTLGEYIRRRRLTLAGNDLLSKKMKVIDVAFKYGYKTPESFSRAFYKFHGIMPSQVKNACSVKSFSRLFVKPDFIGGCEMTYKIEEKSELILVGYKKRFTGVPYGEERIKQEEAFLTSTRAKQWLLIGASCDYSTDYMVITNIDDDGYDFYVAYKLDEWTRKELFNPKITGVDFMDKMGFEVLVIPKQTYVVFETEKKKRPIADYTDIRKKIVTEWLPTTDCVFANAPEVVAMHWRPNGEWAKERYIEICLPIEKKQI